MAPLTSSASLFVRSFTRSFRFVPFRSVLSRVPSLARPFIMLIFSRRGFFGFLFERFIIIWSSPFVLLFRWLLASPPSFHPPVCPRLRLWTYWPTGPEGDRLRPFLFCFRVFSFLLNRLLHPPSHPSPSSHVTCFCFPHVRWMLRFFLFTEFWIGDCRLIIKLYQFLWSFIFLDITLSWALLMSVAFIGFWRFCPVSTRYSLISKLFKFKVT